MNEVSDPKIISRIQRPGIERWKVASSIIKDGFFPLLLDVPRNVTACPLQSRRRMADGVRLSKLLRSLAIRERNVVFDKQ